MTKIKISKPLTSYTAVTRQKQRSRQQMADDDLTITSLEGEVELTAYKSGGPGGQHKNKTESSIRLKHLPTGIVVIAREHRSQIKNRALAWERLIEKLRQRRRKKKPRLPTKVPQAVIEKRLQNKARQSDKKKKRANIRTTGEH